MDSYFLFLAIALLAVISPGPGVILTLSNAIRFGVFGALPGILGIAFGTFIVAALSATGLAIILTTSTMAFNAIKYAGALYLCYLGVKLWRSASVKLEANKVSAKSKKLRFAEGLALQLTNPKALFFFISIFPQFVDFSAGYSWRFLLLVSTYSLVVILIHLLYAASTVLAKKWLSSARGSNVMNRIGGGAFVGLGLGLAASSK